MLADDVETVVTATDSASNPKGKSAAKMPRKPVAKKPAGQSAKTKPKPKGGPVKGMTTAASKVVSPKGKAGTAKKGGKGGKGKRKEVFSEDEAMETGAEDGEEQGWEDEAVVPSGEYQLIHVTGY